MFTASQEQPPTHTEVQKDLRVLALGERPPS